MIDNFSLALSHGLILLAAFRLLFMRELDKEPPPNGEAEPEGWLKGPSRGA